MKVRMKSWTDLAGARPGQFLLAVAKHSAEREIRYENPAIEMANADSDRGPFKHRLETPIGAVIASRRKLGHDVHRGSGLRCPVSGLRKTKFGYFASRGQRRDSMLGKNKLDFSSNGPRQT